LRETGPVSKRFGGNSEKAAEYTGVARTLLGILKADMAVNGLLQLSRRTKLADGVIINVASIHGQDYVEIYVPEREGEIETPNYFAFVVRPAHHQQCSGWGPPFPGLNELVTCTGSFNRHYKLIEFNEDNNTFEYNLRDLDAIAHGTAQYDGNHHDSEWYGVGAKILITWGWASPYDMYCSEWEGSESGTYTIPVNWYGAGVGYGITTLEYDEFGDYHPPGSGYTPFEAILQFVVGDVLACPFYSDPIQFDWDDVKPIQGLATYPAGMIADTNQSMCVSPDGTQAAIVTINNDKDTQLITWSVTTGFVIQEEYPAPTVTSSSSSSRPDGYDITVGYYSYENRPMFAGFDLSGTLHVARESGYIKGGLSFYFDPNLEDVFVDTGGGPCPPEKTYAITQLHDSHYDYSLEYRTTTTYKGEVIFDYHYNNSDSRSYGQSKRVSNIETGCEAFFDHGVWHNAPAVYYTITRVLGESWVNIEITDDQLMYLNPYTGSHINTRGVFKDNQYNKQLEGGGDYKALWDYTALDHPTYWIVTRLTNTDSITQTGFWNSYDYGIRAHLKKPGLVAGNTTASDPVSGDLYATWATRSHAIWPGFAENYTINLHNSSGVISNYQDDFHKTYMREHPDGSQVAMSFLDTYTGDNSYKNFLYANSAEKQWPFDYGDLEDLNFIRYYPIEVRLVNYDNYGDVGPWSSDTI